MLLSITFQTMLLFVPPVVWGKQHLAPDGECAPFCERVYKEAAQCDLTNTPVLPSTVAPLGFNDSCLCIPEEFRESAPACVDCLFRTDIEEEFRDTLLKGMDGCTVNLNLPACPRKCNNIELIKKECEEEDAARSAAATLPTPEATAPVRGGVDNTLSAGPEDSQGATPTINGSATPLLGKGKKTKEDYTQRCICKPQNQEEVIRCYKCMLNYKSTAADQIILPVRRCDPNYGVQGPLYRPTGPKVDDDNDDETVGGVSDEITPNSFTELNTKSTETSTSQRKSKLRSIGSNGYAGLMNLVWWIGIQIFCVIGAIVYFAI